MFFVVNAKVIDCNMCLYLGSLSVVVYKFYNFYSSESVELIIVKVFNDLLVTSDNGYMNISPVGSLCCFRHTVSNT